MATSETFRIAPGKSGAGFFSFDDVAPARCGIIEADDFGICGGILRSACGGGGSGRFAEKNAWRMKSDAA
jgi:hypothetical protein